MNLRVIKGGVMDTVQDLGRNGYQYLGINPGGAMDQMSARVANILVGNSPDEAFIEMHFPASAFFFEQPALIAVTGADFKASVNGEEIPLRHPVLVGKYSILQFEGLVQGTRACLAIHGGINVPKWLNSYSTNVKAHIGGYNGRPLQRDDELPLRKQPDFEKLLGKNEFLALPWKADELRTEARADRILIIPGPEWDHLTEDSKRKFLQRSFTLTPQSDRMGYCLKGGALSLQNNQEMISAGVSFGTIQLLPNGQLIILMADHQTTGGYPRIAQVITAHHSRIAQLKPGEALRFHSCEQSVAEELLLKERSLVQQLQYACNFKLENLLHV
jgi:antagonist of KipI